MGGLRPIHACAKIARMTTSRQIRLACAADLGAMTELYRHLNPDDPELTPTRAIATWSELLDRDGVRVFVADIGYGPIATCTLIIVPNLTRGGRPFGFIENVVTHAAVRGHGHGRALLDEALNTAWRQGCYKVMLLTGRKDEAVWRFYEGAGFDRTAKTGFYVSAPTQRNSILG
jgi:GNAT superfamily N-acetyltransferase